MKHATFDGKLVILGLGGIGQAILPLLTRHINISPLRITILTGDDRGREVAAHYGISVKLTRLTLENYRELLRPLLCSGDFLVNLSLNISSVALVTLCQEIGVLYLDTSIEDWADSNETDITHTHRSDYKQREEVLRLVRPKASTAIVAHGANPGLVSHFVKRALVHLDSQTSSHVSVPCVRERWAELAQKLGVKVIHITENDSQSTNVSKGLNEFVNTWSIQSFAGDAFGPAELGWGTHEATFPRDARRFDFGCGASIYLLGSGVGISIRTWAPQAKCFRGFLFPHNESTSIANYYTVSDRGQIVYRPTVHYVYSPCDDAVRSLHELVERDWQLQIRRRLMMHEVTSGGNELGVLLMGHARGAYWYGSYLSIEAARQAVPHNNATTLPVAAGVLGGIVWAIENPWSGIVEADQLDYERVLQVAEPYLGKMTCAFTPWTPRNGLNSPVRLNDDSHWIWQFSDFREDY